MIVYGRFAPFERWRGWGQGVATKKPPASRKAFSKADVQTLQAALKGFDGKAEDLADQLDILAVVPGRQQVMV